MYRSMFVNIKWNIISLPVESQPHHHMFTVISPIAIVALFSSALGGAKNSDPSKTPGRINIVNRARSCGLDGYQMHLTTKDSYIISLFRVLAPNRTQAQKQSNPVLFLHGLGTDANFWVIKSCDNSIPLSMARRGWDVWLGSVRGTHYSNRHVYYSNTTDQFWDFSFQEIGKYDLSEFIDYVLFKTGAPKLIYVGHSQGCTVIFANLCEFPENNRKIERIFAIGPGLNLHSLRGLLKYVLKLVGSSKVFKALVGRRAFMGSLISYGRSKRGFLSRFSVWFYKSLICYCGGDTSKLLTRNVASRIISDAISYTSVKNVLHFYQVYATNTFAKFDYGFKGNCAHYNSTHPPSYNLSVINVPVHLYCSREDYLTPCVDVQNLKLQLRSVSSFVTVPNSGHLNLVYGRYSGWIIRKHILKVLQGS